MSKLIFKIGAVLFGVAVGMGGTNAQTEMPKTLKIGVIGLFTDASADFGVPMFNGIQLAVDEVNAVGGYLGSKLEMARKDDEANPDVGLVMSKGLVADKVAATIGFCNTGVAAKSLEVFQANKLPLMVPSRQVRR